MEQLWIKIIPVHEFTEASIKAIQTEAVPVQWVTREELEKIYPQSRTSL